MKNFLSYLGGKDDYKARLFTAVKKQIGLPVSEVFYVLHDVASSPVGADGGFTGFTYYSDTINFWRRNRKVTLEMMSELASDMNQSLLESVMLYGGIHHGEWTEDEVGRALYGNYDSNLDGIYDIFARGALEEVARWYDEWEEEDYPC